MDFFSQDQFRVLFPNAIVCQTPSVETLHSRLSMNSAGGRMYSQTCPCCQRSTAPAPRLPSCRQVLFQKRETAAHLIPARTV